MAFGEWDSENKNIWKLHGVVGGVKFNDLGTGAKEGVLNITHCYDKKGVEAQDTFNVYFYGKILSALRRVVAGDKMRLSAKIYDEQGQLKAVGQNYKVLTKAQQRRLIKIGDEFVECNDEEYGEVCGIEE